MAGQIERQDAHAGEAAQLGRPIEMAAARAMNEYEYRTALRSPPLLGVKELFISDGDIGHGDCSHGRPTGPGACGTSVK